MAAALPIVSGSSAAAAPPPPMSVARASYFAAHPDARAAFLAQLARPATNPARLVTPTSGGSWTSLPAAPKGGLCNPLLLTDGSVLVADGDSKYWYKLTPSLSGSYTAGTWSKIATLPIIGGTQYQPLYHASAVLPDGRVIIMGGEYDGGSKEVWTNLGAIYDPVANSWAAVTAPTGTGWSQIGDAQSVMLANGTFMLASCCGYPATNALLDAAALTWTTTGAPPAGGAYQDEQGYELLPSGNVLTLDIWTNYDTTVMNGNANNAEQYNASTGVWTGAGTTPTSLPDPAACGNYEIGPAVLRGNGTVVAFGGNTGCVSGATADPTAIYIAASNKWKAGPNVPAVCGTDGATSCTLADAPAALEPNGNVLFGASAGYGNVPTHFFEFSSTNTISQVADSVNAPNSGSYYYNFLVLPTGQIMETDFSNTPQVYTPVGAPVAAWAPAIKSIPAKLTAGSTYKAIGTQFSGISQGAAYGDDDQASTNYPLVRITNTATGDVAFARTTNFTYSVKPHAPGATSFTLPATIETGASTLSVVANGIASAPVAVTVSAP